MAMIDRHNIYPNPDEYWNIVRKTLEDVFRRKPTDIDALVDKFQRLLGKHGPEEQLLFYHAEPLDVAADLAGRRPSDVEIKAYRQLADQVGWGLP